MKLSNYNIVSSQLLFEYRRLDNVNLSIPKMNKLKLNETDDAIKCDIKLDTSTVSSLRLANIEDEKSLKILTFFENENDTGFYGISETKMHNMIATLKYADNVPVQMSNASNMKFAINLQIQQDVAHILEALNENKCDIEYTNPCAIVTRNIIARNILLLNIKDIFKR